MSQSSSNPSIHPTISVVILSYNHALFLEQTLESVLQQTIRPLEIIFINDGSTDETSSVIQPYLDKITYIEQKNCGLVKSLNKGASKASGDYLLFIGSDDWLETDALQKLAPILDQHQDVAIVHGGITLVDETGQLSDNQNRPAYPLGKHQDIVSLIAQNYIPAPATLCRREALLEAGLFLNYTYCQDWAMWLKLLLNGWYIYGLEQKVAYYRRHANNLTHSKNRLRAVEDEVTMLKQLENSQTGLPQAVKQAFEKAKQQRLKELGWRSISLEQPAKARHAFGRLFLSKVSFNTAAGLVLSVAPLVVYKSIKNTRYYLKKFYSRSVPEGQTRNEVQRVVMLFPQEVQGGARAMVEDLVEGLHGAGVKVHFGQVGRTAITIKNYQTGELTELGRRARWPLSGSWALRGYLKAHQITTLHSHLSTYRLAALAGWRAGVKSIRTIHGRLDRPGMLAWGEQIPFWLTTHLLSQRVITVSERAEADVRRAYGLLPGRQLIKIVNGYRPRPQAGTAQPATDRLTLAFVGRFEAAKGFFELIGAFEQLAERYPQVKLLLIGDGEGRSRINPALVADGRIEVSSGWLGREAVLTRLTAEAQVFVLPSHSEGISIALLEAMSGGLVPLVSEAATSDNVVTDGHNGFVFTTGSQADLLATMLRLVEEQDRLPGYGRCARQTVEERFNQDIMVKRHLDFYNQRP